MATRKKKFNLSKLSLNTKVFIAIVIIIGLALVFSGTPQVAKFASPSRLGTSVTSTAGQQKVTTTTPSQIDILSPKWNATVSGTLIIIANYAGAYDSPIITLELYGPVPHYTTLLYFNATIIQSRPNLIWSIDTTKLPNGSYAISFYGYLNGQNWGQHGYVINIKNAKTLPVPTTPTSG